jgi:maltose alpha-D-glucosyltransferase/alpha-amylase
MIFTMPGVPFLYYGDEIGMRYLYHLPTKEGGYGRTGSRTPMQWKPGKNAGFSASETPYLPVDKEPDAPNIEAQEKDPASLLNTVKALLLLRRGEEDLGSKPNMEILHAGKAADGDRSFLYRRGAFIIGVNPGANTVKVALDDPRGTPVYQIGNCVLKNGRCELEAQSFGVWKT